MMPSISLFYKPLWRGEFRNRTERIISKMSNNHALDAARFLVVVGSACIVIELARLPIAFDMCLLWKQVWDVYLYWGDPALHHFVVLAFVIGNAGVILQVTRWSEALCSPLSPPKGSPSRGDPLNRSPSKGSPSKTALHSDEAWRRFYVRQRGTPRDSFVAFAALDGDPPLTRSVLQNLSRNSSKYFPSIDGFSLQKVDSPGLCPHPGGGQWLVPRFWILDFGFLDFNFSFWIFGFSMFRFSLFKFGFSIFDCRFSISTNGQTNELGFALCHLIHRLQAEEANLPETMCRLSVGMRSVEELRALLRTAKDLMLNTPKSFRKILRSALYANLSQVCTAHDATVYGARCWDRLKRLGAEWRVGRLVIWRVGGG